MTTPISPQIYDAARDVVVRCLRHSAKFAAQVVRQFSQQALVQVIAIGEEVAAQAVDAGEERAEQLLHEAATQIRRVMLADLQAREAQHAQRAQDLHQAAHPQTGVVPEPRPAADPDAPGPPAPETEVETEPD